MHGQYQEYIKELKKESDQKDPHKYNRKIIGGLNTTLNNMIYNYEKLYCLCECLKENFKIEQDDINNPERYLKSAKEFHKHIKFFQKYF